MKNLFNWARDLILLNDIWKSFYEDRKPSLILQIHEETSKGLKLIQTLLLSFSLISSLSGSTLSPWLHTAKAEQSWITTFPTYSKLLPVKEELVTLFRLLPFKCSRGYIYIQTDTSLGSLEFIRSTVSETALWSCKWQLAF